MRRLAGLVTAFALVLAGGASRADEGASKDPALEEARTHVQKAKVHYDLGEYQQAAEEYILVYRIRPLPALLFNIGQAYRQAGLYEKARQFYKSYLRESPDQKSKPVIEKAIKEIDELLAKEKRAREVGPNGVTGEPPQMAPAPGAPARKDPAPVAARAAPAAPSPAAAPPPATAPVAAAPATASTSAVRPSSAPPASDATAHAAPATSRERTASAAPAVASKRGATVAVASPPAQVKPAAPSEVTQHAQAGSTVEESSPLYKKWWLWTAVGVVAVGAGAAAMNLGGNTAPASHFGTTKVFP